MALKELSDKLYPTFIQKFAETASDLCRLFLSASSMKEKAVVRHVVCDTPEQAWTTALTALQEALEKNNIEPTILRADWVTTRESTTWEDCLNQISARRRNWFFKGIALDKEYRLAFLRQELNANLILYSPEKEDTKGIFQADKAEAYCRQRFNCAWPKLDKMDEIELFVTEGVFISEEMSEPLTMTGKGIGGVKRDFSKVEDDIFLELSKKAANYLVRQCGKNGKFIYGLLPADDTIIPGYNTHRHFGTLYAMAEAYEFCDNESDKKELGAAIERGFEYGIKNLLRYRETKLGKEEAYFLEGRATTIGISGLAILAFSKWQEVSGTTKYIPLMQALARGILVAQKPEGNFIQVLNIQDFSVRKEFSVTFYDGEALFGMLRLYGITNEEWLLEAVEKAIRYFIDTKYWENHDHWMQYTLNELTIYRPEQEYFKFGLDNILFYLPKIAKSFAHAPTHLEMIMAAANMIRRMKSLPEMEELSKRVDEQAFYSVMTTRAERMLNGYFWPEMAMYFQNPERMLGSFFIRADAFHARIDDVQHTLSGLLAYSKYKKDKSFEIKPVTIKSPPEEKQMPQKIEIQQPEVETIKIGQRKRMVIEAGALRLKIETEWLKPEEIKAGSAILLEEENINQPLRVGILRKSKPRSWEPDSPMFTMFYTAKNFNIELLLFTPADIDFENKTVKATILEGSNRIKKTVPLPKIIDNPASIFSGKYGKELRQLSKEYFFTRHLENASKQRVYDMLLKDGRYKEFLIDTHTVENFEHFLSLFGQYSNNVILKPAGGNEGKGVAHITFDGEQYAINIKKEKIFLKTVDELQNFYNEHFSAVKHVLQPYIVSRTHLGNPFDIRIHTRRGAEGKFQVFLYPRIGHENGVVSNVGSGGYTMKLDTFLKTEFGNDWEIIYNKLFDLGNNFPEYYQTFFKSRLFDVGIDVGIQKNGSDYDFKIFEVNTYLGGSFVRVEDTVTRFEYFHYIAQKLRESGISVDQPKPLPISASQTTPPLRVGIMKKIKNHFWELSNARYPMFCMAKQFNIELLFFNPQDIDFENKTVNAITLENKSVVHKVVPLPRIVDNDIMMLRGETLDVMKRIKELCYFIRPINAWGKQKFYEELSKDGRFNEFLITTHAVTNFEQFLSLLKQYHNSVVLKPNGGVGGSGVVRIAHDGKQYLATVKNETSAIKSSEELLKFYKEHFTKVRYLLQPYVTSRTRQGNPFDIRLHARRGEGGKFKIFAYPRIGNANGVISNIVAGGYTMKLNPFLKNEFGDDWKIVYDKLKDLGDRFPEYYQSFFPDTIYDIGIDVGIQKVAGDYELKLFEAYIQPGFTLVRNEVAVTNFAYYRYIDQKLRDGSIK